MNLLNTQLLLNGNLVRNSTTGFWQLGNISGALDPSIPNLELINPIQAWSLVAGGLTLEELDALGGIDSLPFSLDTYDGGIYLVTGTDATLTKAAASKTLPASAGSYAITGTAASLEFGRKVIGLSGAYTITGTAASLEFGRHLIAAAGSYAITGTAASLEFGRHLIAASGSYAITGTAASLEYGRVLAIGGGSYAVTGTDATLVKSGTAKTLAASAGSYALTGTAASLEYGRKVVALAGSYAVTGTDATLTKAGAKVLTADAGSYALTGTDATLTKSTAVIPSVNPDRIGGAGWQKKKPKKKDELVEEVVAEVVQAVPQPIQDETRIIALRMAQAMTVRQLQEIRTIEALISRVEAEIAEMDDEEVLLLAA